ncbi:hypothetical protein BBO99_00003686, partial [Phytophthora kernoviae]
RKEELDGSTVEESVDASVKVEASVADVGERPVVDEEECLTADKAYENLVSGDNGTELSTGGTGAIIDGEALEAQEAMSTVVNPAYDAMQEELLVIPSDDDEETLPAVLETVDAMETSSAIDQEAPTDKGFVAELNPRVKSIREIDFSYDTEAEEEIAFMEELEDPDEVLRMAEQVAAATLDA